MAAVLRHITRGRSSLQGAVGMVRLLRCLSFIPLLKTHRASASEAKDPEDGCFCMG